MALMQGKLMVFIAWALQKILKSCEKKNAVACQCKTQKTKKPSIYLLNILQQNIQHITYIKISFFNFGNCPKHVSRVNDSLLVREILFALQQQLTTIDDTALVHS